MPDFRLLALDLDGTLIGEELTISPRALQAIASVRSKGIVVTLATGRTFREAQPYAAQLGLTAPLICHQGALVQTEEHIFYHRTVPRARAGEVIDFALNHELHVNAYVGDSLYVERMTREAEIYAGYAPELEIQPVGDLRKFMKDKDATKLLLIGSTDLMDTWWPQLRQRWGASLQVVRSHLNLVEFTRAGVSKGNALAFVAEYLHIPQQAVMVIGDNQNDLSMVRWAGWGVAMAQGHPDVRLAADTVAPPLSEDGAAVAIERFILGYS